MDYYLIEFEFLALILSLRAAVNGLPAAIEVLTIKSSQLSIQQIISYISLSKKQAKIMPIHYL